MKSCHHFSFNLDTNFLQSSSRSKECGKDRSQAHSLGFKNVLAEKSKEYNAYKLTEKRHIEEEVNSQLKVQLKAMDAIVFLPGNLL